MTENNKPEWFEIAESDGPAKPAKVRRTLPVAAVLAASLIIGVGAVVAQTQEEPPANATETTSVANAQVISTATAVATATPKAVVTPAHSAMVNPKIATPPTGGEDEGDEREHEGRGHYGERESHLEGDND